MTKEKGEDGANRRAIREQIDENLKRVYRDSLSEELPDRFRDLLAQLKARDDTSQGGTGQGGAG